MEIVKGLRDLEQKIEEMGLMETFKKLLLEHERVAIQSGKPIDKRLQNMPDSPAKLADALDERFAVQSQFDKSSLVSQGRNLALSQSLIPDSPTKFADALEMVEPKKRGRKKKVQL